MNYLFIYRTTISNLKHSTYLCLLLGRLLSLSSCNSNSPIETENKSNSETTNKNKEADLSHQMLSPCHWEYSVEQNFAGEATLVFTAKIDSAWHLYSQHIADGSTLAMVYTYEASANYQLTGMTEEGIAHKEFDPYLEMEIQYFEHEAVFKQKIKILSKNDFSISGTIDYTACLSQCVTSVEDFTLNLKGNTE